MRRNVFWSSFPVCWHEFNTHFHLKPKKGGQKFTDKGGKKARSRKASGFCPI